MRYLREGGLVTQTSYRCQCQNYIFSTDLVLHVLSDTDTYRRLEYINVIGLMVISLYQIVSCIMCV